MGKKDDAAEEDTVVQKDASNASGSSGEGFSSRTAFLFAAVGCAVGFGNVWRFPYLVYDHGGLAFIVVYCICLMLVAAPTTILEMGLGQICRGGQIQAWSRLGRFGRASGMVGWVAFNICTYYPVLLTWSLLYFAYSLKPDMPWTVTDAHKDFCEALKTQAECGGTDYCRWNADGGICNLQPLKFAADFFRDSCYAHSDFTGRDRDIKLTGISGKYVLCLGISWVCNVLALIAGAKVLGYIMYVTMTLPTVFLVILIIVGALLPGSREGVRWYIGKFEVDKLTLPTWVNAVGQGVFSTSVAQGTMAAFTAHNKKGQNFVVDGLIIIAADTIYALLAGFSVFSVIGYLAHAAGVPVDHLELQGISLAFMTYPVGLSRISNYFANILSALFFATLWLIGMDTLVALVEALVLMLCNSRTGVRWGVKRWHATIGLSIFFFLVPGLLTATNLGYALLDCLDDYNALVQSFGAGIECFVAGWIYFGHKSVERVGKLAYYVHAVTLVLGSILFAVLARVVNTWVGLLVGLGVPILGFLISVFVLAKKTDARGNELSAKDRMWYLSIYNLEPMRKLFNDEGCQNTWWRVPLLWSYAVKYVVPFIVFFLTMSGLLDPKKMYKRPNEDAPYPWYIFLIGQLSPIFLALCIFVFLIFPDTMLPLQPPTKEGQEDTILGQELLPLFERKGLGDLSDDEEIGKNADDKDTPSTTQHANVTVAA